MHYLQPHRGGKWRVRVVVPPDLVENIGKRVLTRSTGTEDVDRAMKIAVPITKEFRRIIARAAGKPVGRVNLKFVREDRTSTEWFTPKWIFDSMPGVVFDLDPAAPPGGVPWVPVRCHYSKEDDGLSRPWHGFCWLNPPYGIRTNRMLEWIDRFVAHDNGILFTSANSYCRWWQALSRQADAVLLIQGYVNAVDGLNIDRKSRASFGSCMFAMGERAVAALRLAEDNGLGTLHTHTGRNK
jgi:hypothetical protein